MQGHDLLDGIAGGGPVLPRLGQGLGHHRQQPRYACAEPGQGSVLCLALHGHAHGQPVRGHRGVIHAEGQQGCAGQPPERLIDALRPGGRAGAGVRSRPCCPAAYSSAGKPRRPTAARPR